MNDFETVNHPRWIGRERLILWLNGLLSDEEAASVGSAHEFEYLKWYQTENLE